MKKIFLIIGMVIGLTAFYACSEDEIMTYSSDSFIEFVTNVTDSAEFSFTFHPGKERIEYKGVVVRLVGLPSDHDRTYKLSVVSEGTTASASNYSIPSEFTFPKGAVTDTARITLINTANLEHEAVRLMLKLEETSDFKLGETTHTGYIVWINNTISRPDWWNSTIVNSYLGNYSNKKYRLFIEVTGVGTIDPTNVDECRFRALQLKQYLRAQKAMGNTVYEEDGYTEMTVNVIG